MVQKIAIYICPKEGCSAISSSKTKCPKHGDLMLRGIYEMQKVETAKSMIKDLGKELYEAFTPPNRSGRFFSQ